MQCEERIRNETGINILKECLKEKEKVSTKTRNTQERREYLMRNGYDQAGIDQLRERNVNVVKTLKEKVKEVQKQTQYNKIRKGQYNERYRHIKTEIPIQYLEKEGRGRSARLIARARCGNFEEGNKY